MGTEEPCEGIGKKMKFRIGTRPRIHRHELKKEIIITENGPEISDAEPLINKTCNKFLRSHREPIIIDSKFEVGQVVDRIAAKPSKFDWY